MRWPFMHCADSFNTFLQFIAVPFLASVKSCLRSPRLQCVGKQKSSMQREALTSQLTTYAWSKSSPPLHTHKHTLSLSFAVEY